MNIEIVPIEAHDMNLEDDFMCLEKPVRELEAKYKEAIEYLAKGMVEAERNWRDNWCDNIYNDPDATDNEIVIACRKANAIKIKLIEEATGQSWKELTE